MAKYIFLDSWVLVNYTHPNKAPQLAQFLVHNGYTVLFNGLSLTEVHNAGWQGGGADERGARIARFLGNQRCHIVRPEEVWQAEFLAFPRSLTAPPVRLNLDTLPQSSHADAILNVLRQDAALLNAGIDIVRWKSEWEQLKQSWFADVEAILQDGVQQGELYRTPKGRYEAVNADLRERFLFRLDMRSYQDISPHALQTSGRSLLDYYGRTSIMRSVRLSTLLFWYHYIASSPGQTTKKSRSDLGDFSHLSVAPYCDTITVDTKMAPTVQRALHELSCPCRVLTYRELENELRV